jgi:CBS domain-containing protein
MSLERFRRPLETADAAASVKRAACAMRDQGVGCLVVTKTAHPLGIVTDRDLVARVLAEGRDASGPVGDDDLLVLLGRGLGDLCEGIENRSDATESC